MGHQINRRTFVKSASSIAGSHASQAITGMVERQKQVIAISTPLTLFGYADTQLLEAVDANHPNLVSLVQGPLVLMAVAESQPVFASQGLLRAKPVNNHPGDWIATSISGSEVTMRPFMTIDKESYSTYVQITG